ncbi:type II toxin-antitoxin system VapC family toxin [Candidatus Woesearchaeota archaeon]|nr:type II toxin-antitoxin system VapC family toxin [Candidatus Woesearchaeota archaeon]
MDYIDASAFVKYYSDDEAGVEKVKQLIERAINGEDILISSAIMIGEVVSAFDKWVRKKIMTNEQLEETLSEFVNSIKKLAEGGSLILVDANISSVSVAVNYIVKHHLSVNDALHLYAALINKDIVDLFICCDRNLIKAAENEGLDVFNPEND